MSDLEVTFPRGEIDRKIAELGLNLGEFAAEAEISDKTLARARRGEAIRRKSFGRILMTLSRHSMRELSA